MTFPFSPNHPNCILTEPAMLRINMRSPLTRSMSWCKIGDQTAFAPFGTFSRYPQQTFIIGSESFTDSNGTVSAGPGGPGLSRNTTSGASKYYEPIGSFNNAATNKFASPSSGTVAVFCSADFAVGDSLGHLLFFFGQPNADASMIYKHSDGHWYIGLISGGTDYRINVSATGTYTVNQPFVGAYTWAAGGTITAYIDGKVVGTHAAPASPVTYAGGSFQSITLQNEQTFTGLPWSYTAGNTGFVYWAAIWDTVLSASDIQFLNAEPWAMFVPEIDFPALSSPAVTRSFATIIG